MSYRIALIGTGAFAAEHVRAVRAHPDRAELVAAVNPNAVDGAKFAADHTIPAFYTDTRAMLDAEKPDLVQIVTPPYTHAEISQLCLEAGAHVLCEKPLCGSLADWDRLANAENRSGRTLSTIFQWRFGAAAQHFKRLIDAGTLGAPRLILCETLWYRSADYYNAAPWRGQRDKAFGGSIAALGIHLIDLMLWLRPDWTHIHAWTTTLDRDIDIENIALAHIKFSDGGLASLTHSALSPRQTTHLRFDFPRATVEIVEAVYHADNNHWKFTPLDESVGDVWKPENEARGGISAQIGALLDSLDRNERPLVSGDEARRIIEFMTCLYKSARTGETVMRGSITPDDPFYASMWGG